MYQKTKHKGRKYFCMHCLQNLTTEEMLNNHKLYCLLINGTQKWTFEQDLLDLEIMTNKYLYHLKFMQILNTLIKK